LAGLSLLHQGLITDLIGLCLILVTSLATKGMNFRQLNWPKR
jgi:UPF0716 family protein affecting phage T7 exclusion